MRFECTIMKAKNREGKSDTSLAEEIKTAENTGHFNTHESYKSFCILNDVVVVSIHIFAFNKVTINQNV